MSETTHKRINRFYMPYVIGDLNPYGDAAWYQGIHSPYYNDSHVALAKMVRELVETDVIPNVHDWDEKGEIPSEFRKKAYATGMAVLACGHPFPVKHGPLLPDFLQKTRLDIFHAMVVFEEVARAGSIGVEWGLGGGLCIGLPPILAFGSEALKAKVAPDVLRGDKVVCLAVTEPHAGSDVGNIKTSAVKSDCGNFYIVNGVKKWITNGCFSDYMTVLVRTGEEGVKGVSLLLIETKSEGVTTSKMKCSGVWCSGTTLITLDNVKVPVSNLIGKENKGFRYVVHNFNYERIMICAQAVSSARVCYEEAWKHAQRRKTFGKLLIEHQVIRFKLGEMARQIEACQAWLEQLAFQIETMHTREADLKLGGPTALLKVQCTKVLEICAREAAQIFGGLSFTRGGLGEKVERLCREVRALAIPGGSEEIMLDLGVRMTNKIAQLGQQMLGADGKPNPALSKQIALAKRVGVNIDLFGEGYPFADPSWYLTFNSAFYNDSHKAFRRFFRTFCEKEILPNISQWERNRSIPPNTIRRLLDLGIGALVTGFPYPNKHGIECLNNVQLDLFHELIAIDELSRAGSAGLVASIWSTVSVSVEILRGSCDVRASEALIQNIRSGKSTIALCIQEPGVSGHDLACLTSVARRKDTQCQLNGKKTYVTRGTSANLLLVAAKADEADGDQFAFFLASRSSPGISVIPIECTGNLTAGMAEICFDFTPCALIVWKEKAHGLLTKALDHERWVIAIEAVRLARVCYEDALKHTQAHESFGKKLMDHQGIRWKLGEMARQIEGGFAWIEALTYHMHCSGTRESSEQIGSAISLLKLHSTKLLEYCSREANQILGTTSYSRGCVSERVSREVRGLALAFGSEEVLLVQGVTRSIVFGNQIKKVARM